MSKEETKIDSEKCWLDVAHVIGLQIQDKSIFEELGSRYFKKFLDVSELPLPRQIPLDGKPDSNPIHYQKIFVTSQYGYQYIQRFFKLIDDLNFDSSNLTIRFFTDPTKQSPLRLDCVYEGKPICSLWLAPKVDQQ